MSRLRITTTLAAAILFATASGAFAAPNFVATDDADLHKNPKNSSAEVNYVEEGDLLTITKCSGNWCFAKVPGPDGWIRKDYIESLDDEEDDAPVNNGNNGAGIGLGITIGPGGPSIVVGTQGSQVAGPTKGQRACFFEHANYIGNSFCVGANKTVNNLNSTGLNNAISSIKLFGVTTDICDKNNLGGTCITISSDTNNLTSKQFNDMASSVDIY